MQPRHQPAGVAVGRDEHLAAVDRAPRTWTTRKPGARAATIDTAGVARAHRHPRRAPAGPDRRSSAAGCRPPLLLDEQSAVVARPSRSRRAARPAARRGPTRPARRSTRARSGLEVRHPPRPVGEIEVAGPGVRAVDPRVGDQLLHEVEGVDGHVVQRPAQRPVMRAQLARRRASRRGAPSRRCGCWRPTPTGPTRAPPPSGPAAPARRPPTPPCSRRPPRRRRPTTAAGATRPTGTRCPATSTASPRRTATAPRARR